MSRKISFEEVKAEIESQSTRDRNICVEKKEGGGIIVTVSNPKIATFCSDTDFSLSLNQFVLLSNHLREL